MTLEEAKAWRMESTVIPETTAEDFETSGDAFSEKEGAVKAEGRASSLRFGEGVSDEGAGA